MRVIGPGDLIPASFGNICINFEQVSITYCYMKEEKEPFFEKQSYFSLQCGLYSVNHLLGARLYSESSMKDICYELSN
jgi:hypothetical protein